MDNFYVTLLFHTVLDFGATGDGVTDNVKSFQSALDAAGAGGIGKTHNNILGGCCCL